MIEGTKKITADSESAGLNASISRIKIFTGGAL